MKRKLLDNGNIWQKSDGRWIGMVRYKDEYGVKQRKSFSSKKKKTLQGILTMLDYLISLGNQDSTQDAEEESVSTEDEYDFDNAYAEYLNDTDDGLYEDDTDDEDEYYGMAM